MALHPPSNRPPPLNIEPPSMPAGSAETKQPPKTPGNKITSFFGWKTASSPGAESTSTEISDTGRSPLPSPLAQPFAGSPYKVGDQSLQGFPVPPAGASRGSMHGNGTGSRDLSSTVADLEKELREVSAELAGSIRREMELEDLVERLQQEVKGERRSSDYFSDYSGSSSIIRSASDGAKSEDIDKVKRMAEQERAQLKVELSQRWQEERSKRMACESHVQILENQMQQYRRERDEVSNLASKTKELETALEDTRRKLAEERQLKDNFEDLLTGMRVELEQLRNERDHLRDEVIPSLSHSKGRISAIAEEEGGFTGSPRNSMIGLSRSNSLARRPMKPGGSLSRSNSVSNRDRNESKESLAERVKDVEAQRDALHQTLRYLLSRHAMEARETQKRITILEMELERAQQPGPPRKHGYEREVRNLREEINHLRRRADDAMEQKWQCEKGLAGLKMDLDRAEQETESLRQMLQEHDEGSMQAASASLEAAYNQLQADLEAAAENSPPDSLSRAEQVAGQVRQRLDQNRALRERLAETITKGDREQRMSAMRINDMQSKLKTLEEALMTAQQHSEEAMAKHEEEVRALKDSHNANLTRARMGIKSPLSLSPRPESSPFAGGRSPRLDQTTSGEAVPLSQAIQIEQLELRVKQLEKGLREAEFEMEEVVGLMNKAQGEVAQLQSDRYVSSNARFIIFHADIFQGRCTSPDAADGS
ncbi:hypothetical protein VTN31DRAFT_6251 [Thermomyces dupontii]|uniref:uncharacterized protein n=1 Tax=Talaromyces thermophilus TaxID=28565 RepID=UPI0037447502